MVPNTVTDPETFLDTIIELNGTRYERTRPITDYRRDPGEARILYLCHHVSADGTQLGGEYVMKVKVQVPPRPASNDPQEALPGPSETTAAEWMALQKFSDNGLEGVPHLIASTCVRQGATGPFPDGYVAYTVMTRMPGMDLMAMKFWSQDDDVKERIRHAFVSLLKNTWRLDISPYDCALRNIIWDAETHSCSIVDFEYYRSAKEPAYMNEKEEMQRWGIVQRPPPSHWAIEWGLIKEPNAAAD